MSRCKITSCLSIGMRMLNSTPKDLQQQSLLLPLTPLGAKPINQLGSRPTVSSSLPSLCATNPSLTGAGKVKPVHKTSDVVAIHALPESESVVFQRMSCLAIAEYTTPRKTYISRFASVHVASNFTQPTFTSFASVNGTRHREDTLPPPPRLRRIITTRYFMSNQIGAELYFRAARKTASIAAIRYSFLPGNSDMADSPHKSNTPLPPATPTPIAGSSPFVKAQRHIHHMRYGSVEVKSRAKAMREGLLRARKG